jgi:hypothetical protein
MDRLWVLDEERLVKKVKGIQGILEMLGVPEPNIQETVIVELKKRKEAVFALMKEAEQLVSATEAGAAVHDKEAIDEHFKALVTHVRETGQRIDRAIGAVEEQSVPLSKAEYTKLGRCREGL